MNDSPLMRRPISASLKLNMRSLLAFSSRLSLFPAQCGLFGKSIHCGGIDGQVCSGLRFEPLGRFLLSNNRHRIEHYIKPYLGDVAVKDLTTLDLNVFYDFLQDKPAVILKGHKKTDATVCLSVIEKTHALLRSALKQAVI